MTRPTRTLLVVGLLAVGAVVALGALARRYGTLLEERRDRGLDVASEVSAYVAVREDLRAAFDAARGAEPAAVAERLADALAAALAARGIARERYLYIDGLVRDWEDRDLAPPAPYRALLVRLRGHLRSLSTAPFDPAAGG